MDLQSYDTRLTELSQLLKSKTWFAFDLDDTLHSYRKASKAAINATLSIINSKYTIPVHQLGDSYLAILSQSTSHAFTDGKTSFDYRRERFAKLLAHHAIPPDRQILDQMLHTYEAVLDSSLMPKPGALDLLGCLKAMGKKIAVVTEGPHDAQERALKTLGIAHMVDFLATTNRFGVSKKHGLFGEVLRYLGLSKDDMVVVGDSYERDIVPATADGIMAVHYVGEVADLEGEVVKIDSLQTLEGLLRA